METATIVIKTTNVLIKFLGSPICKEIQSIWKYEEDIQKLANTIELVGYALSDMERKPIEEQSTISGYYKRLREVFLDAEDFLDKVETHKKMQEADNRTFNTVRRFVSSSNQVYHAVEAHDEIKQNRKNLAAIEEDLKIFAPISRSISESTKRPYVVGATEIIGRDEDKRRIIDLLLGFSGSQKKIPIVSIVGIGGMGKSTVAQLVFDDESRLIGHFDLKLWVSDSEKFDMRSLLKDILQSISPEDNSLHNLGDQQMQKRLVKEIRDKKYLLVLDDVRHESRKNWMDLESLLICGHKESRILVTTRSRKTAKVIGSDSTYELEGLSDNYAQQLFERMAYDGSSMDRSLIEISRVIVKKCSQVPLALKTIGSLLFRESKPTWERVRDTEFAKIKQEGNDLIPILKISYDDLDPTLRQCFRYCALFPKNAIVSTEFLSSIWLANGCIKTNRDDSAEVVCNEYLAILYNRCFLEQVEMNKWGDVTLFRMHDLMHDLAKEVAGEEMLVVDSGIMVEESTNKLVLEKQVRHMNLKCTIEATCRISTFEPRNTRLRTLIHHDVFSSPNPWGKIVSAEKVASEYQVLRLLDLQKWGIGSLPDSIGKLIHLRYIDLSYNEFVTLPNSIGGLWNLQSLLLKFCTKLDGLPPDVVKLINLMHLNIEGCAALNNMPAGMGALTSLRTLQSFIVGPRKSKRLARLEDLEHLTKLQGDLTIKLPHNNALQGGDGRSLLINKRLKKLKIEWTESIMEGEGDVNDMDDLAKLQPHPDLEEFRLYGYEGCRFPPWQPSSDLSVRFPNLVSILIHFSTRCQQLPSFSKLECLKRLTICNMLSLEYIEEDNAAALFFPSLEYLWLLELPRLKGWCRQQDNNGEREHSSLQPPLMRLTDLHIYGCPCLKMTAMPLPAIGDGKAVFSTMFKETFSGTLRFSDRRYPACKLHISYSHLLSLPFKAPISLMMTDAPRSNMRPIFMDEEFKRVSNCIVSLNFNEGLMFSILLQSMKHFTALRGLCIWNCEKFTFEGDDENTQSLQHMPNEAHSSFLECKEGEMPWDGLKSLEALSLTRLPRVVRLPEGLQLLTSLKSLEIVDCNSFSIASQEGQMPWKGLKSLETLHLIKLPKMTRLPEGLQFLTSLKSLYIDRCDSLKMNCQEVEMPWSGLNSLEALSLTHLPNMERLPEGLQFLTSLKSLEVFECDSLGLDSWKVSRLKSLQTLKLIDMREMKMLPEGLHFLTSLKSLQIEDCYELEMNSQGGEIPWKGLKSLETLKFRGLKKMVRLPEGLHFLTSLKSLQIEDCSNIEMNSQEGENPWKGLQSLETLEFRGLDKMVRLPEGLHFLTSLQSLEIICCDSLGMNSQTDGIPWKGLKSLATLKLLSLRKIEMLPEGLHFLTSLKSLELSSCHFLGMNCQARENPWKGLKSLETLQLRSLEKMVRLPEGLQFLTSLKSLQIKYCSNVEMNSQGGEIPWKGLQSLEALEFTGLDKMERLPEGLQFLTSLKSLEIEDCYELEMNSQGGEIPWKELKSLETLKFMSLKKMVRLPEGLHFLTSLKSLEIGGFWCPIEMKCQEGEFPWQRP